MKKLSDAKRAMAFAADLMDNAKLGHDKLHASAGGFLSGLRVGRAEGKKLVAKDSMKKIETAFWSVFAATKGWHGDEIGKVWKRIKELAEKMP